MDDHSRVIEVCPDKRPLSQLYGEIVCNLKRRHQWRATGHTDFYSSSVCTRCGLRRRFYVSGLSSHFIASIERLIRGAQP